MSGSRWTRGAVTFPAALLAEIDGHLCAAYPDEGCGYATGPAAATPLTTFVPMENLQDRYHALDPAAFPRTARTAYLLHPLKFERAYEEGRAAGEPIKVIVHSHADHDAYFSAEDLAFAMADGGPTRDCAYLVVSVRDGQVRDRKLFSLDDSGTRYVETPFMAAEEKQ